MALSELPPVPFIAVTPCRVADTRGNGFTGAYGPPSLVANATRNFTITGRCGIPSGVVAVSFNFAALNVGGAGDLRVFPAGGGVPLVSTLNYNASTPNIANAAVVPLGTGGAITVQADAVAIDLIIDLNGYYASAPATSSNAFLLINSGFFAILGETTSIADGAVGVGGQALGASGATYGVYGKTHSSSSQAAGVYGLATSSTGETYGVQGLTGSTATVAAGLYGTASQSDANGGKFYNVASGDLTAISTGNYGLLTNGEIFGSSLVIAGSPKNFAAPHPLDPSKEIRYASVEAPTVDVYFRGTATLANGYARIEVPDHFRFTAREGTYMTTLTPVGRPSSLGVESEGSEGIVVRGSGNTRFHYIVYAERAEIEEYEPVQKNVHFTPAALEKVQMLKTLPRSTKALLIRNGTLNSDGTYNEATARAMGWTVPEAKDQEPAPRR